ncbi:hypothetical protein MLD38_012987 [Melastoma candidum]|uniref:Uncharacterized protein n=1 Tax=Melastoma candidum TaxID=119954 RepID=A0ACB9R7J6_9MYRT|nr:hypothetical protein MLD38_012987 [Melastoma candidum]
MAVDFSCADVDAWKEALSSYSGKLRSLSEATSKPDLIVLDDFYRNELPGILSCRNPNPHLTRSELVQIMRWKLSRGKWRPRLMDFVSNLDEDLVESSSSKAFQSLPDVSKAVSELTVLKGVGPATASAVLAAYAPHVAPFMSDEAMEAALGHSKDYSLKQYLLFVEKLQKKAKELSSNSENQEFTPSDVERAIWSSSIDAKLKQSPTDVVRKSNTGQNPKKKRKR